MPRGRRKRKPSTSKPEQEVQTKKKKEESDDRIYIDVGGRQVPARIREEKPKTREELIKEEFMMEGQLHNFLVNRTARRLVMQCYKIPTQAYSKDSIREEKNAEIRLSIREQAERRGIKLNDNDIVMEALPFGSEIYVKAYAYIDGKRHGDIERDDLPTFIPIGKEGLYREE